MGFSFIHLWFLLSTRFRTGSLVQILRHGCRRRRRCGMIVRSTTTTFIIIIIEQQCIVVGHRSRSSNRTTDMTMSTHPPIPFLTSATAITDALTLYTTFHFHRRVPGRRRRRRCGGGPVVVVGDTARVTPDHGQVVEVVWIRPTTTTTTTQTPSQILFRFFLTRRGLGFGSVVAKLCMQAHDIVTILLTRRTAVMKVPTFGTAVGMDLMRRFNVGTGRGGAFGIVPVALRSLIVGVTHESDTEKLALHGIPGVA